MKRPYFLFVAALVTAYSGISQGHVYPVRPVRVVLPLVPGGNLDIVARAISQRLGEAPGQQVIVENRPGASSLVGTQLVAKSAPDGYTLLAMANTFTAVPAVIANPGYDPVRDITGVTLTCKVAQVLVVNRALPVRSVQGLIALAQVPPGELSYASSGNGSTGHFAAELFDQKAGVKMLHVPYKGMPRRSWTSSRGRS
jgi:tripartite-type tricarboxylate transporter receptor subunit TctC